MSVAAKGAKPMRILKKPFNSARMNLVGKLEMEQVSREYLTTQGVVNLINCH